VSAIFTTKLLRIQLSIIPSLKPSRNWSNVSSLSDDDDETCTFSVGDSTASSPVTLHIAVGTGESSGTSDGKDESKTAETDTHYS
jgi:hypothetical protein